MALIVIMEPATESPNSAGRNYHWKVAPVTKSKSFWTLGLIETFISYKKEQTNTFPILKAGAKVLAYFK